MSEYTFELNAIDRASPVVEEAIQRIRAALETGSTQLSSALHILPNFDPAAFEQLLTSLNQIGDRAVERARVVGEEIGQGLSSGAGPGTAGFETLGTRLNAVLRESLAEARTQITQFTETTRILPGGTAAGDVLQFAEQWQQGMLRSIQTVATELRTQLAEASRAAGLESGVVTGQFQGVRVASASSGALVGALGTPETAEAFRLRVDQQRSGTSDAAARNVEQAVRTTEEIYAEAVNRVTQGLTLTQEHLAALRADGTAFDLRDPTSRSLTPISGPIGVRDLGQGQPSVYQLRPGEGTQFDPVEQTVQLQRATERAIEVLNREAAAGEAAAAADQARATATENLARLQSLEGTATVQRVGAGGTAPFAEFGAGGRPSFFESTGAPIEEGSAQISQLQKQLFRTLETEAASEDRTRATRAETAAEAERTARGQANLARLLQDPQALRVGQYYRSGAGEFFSRQGQQAFAGGTPEDQIRINELNAQYLNLLRRRNSEMERVANTQGADNSLSGLVNRFAGGAGGVGFDAHAGFKPDEFAGNIAGTFGVLARYGAAGVGIQAAFQGISQIRTEIVDYQSALANLDEVLATTHTRQVDINGAIEAAAPAGIGAAEAINLGADALARYRTEIEGGASASGVMVTSLQNIAQAALLTGQAPKEAAEHLLDASQGFGLGSSGQSRILDAVENARRNYGGDRGQILQAIGDAGDLASSAGVSPEELANMVALIQARTGASGSSVASTIERTISRQGTSTFRQALSGLGIEDTGNITTEIVAMSRAWDGLTKVQRDALVAQLGGARQARELLPLLEEGRQLLDANSSSYRNVGAAAEQYARQQATIAGVVRQISGELKDFAQLVGQSGLFTFIGPLAIGLRDIVAAGDQMLRVFDALPAPVRELTATVLEALVAIRLFGSAQQQLAVGGALRNVPVLGGFARRIGLPTEPGGTAAVGAPATLNEAGTTAAASITGAGQTFATEVVAASREAAQQLLGGGAAGGEAEAAGGAAAGEATAAGAVVARMTQMVQATVAAETTARQAAVEEETTGEIEARAAAAATVAEAMIAGGEQVEVALAAVAQLISLSGAELEAGLAGVSEVYASATEEMVAAFGFDAATIEAAAAEIGVASSTLAAAMERAALGMSLQGGGGAIAAGETVAAGAAAGGAGIAGALLNPMTLAIGGLIAIGGITNHMHELDSAAAQGANALQAMAGASTASDFQTAADAMRSARHQIAAASSGPLGTVAGFLTNAGGRERDLQLNADYASSMARRLTAEQGNSATLAQGVFGPSGTDIGTGLAAMKANGIDAATQLQAVAQALGIVGANANGATSALAAVVGRPNVAGLQYSSSLVGDLAGFGAGLGTGGLLNGLYKQVDLSTPQGRRDANNTLATGTSVAGARFDDLLRVEPGNQRDVSARIDRALGARQTGDLITDEDKNKIADAIASSYGISGGSKADRDRTRGDIRNRVLARLNQLQAEAQQGRGSALTDDGLNTLLNGDGKNNPGILSTIQAARADAFDPSGGSGPGGPLANAVSILQNIASRSDPRGSHYAGLIAAMHDAEDKLAQARIGELEKLRQAADANTSSPAELAHVDQSFFDREIAAAGADTNQLISIINQMTDGQVKVARAVLENAVRVAQAAVSGIAHDPDLRSLLPQAQARFQAALDALNAFKGAQPYRTGPGGAAGGLTDQQNANLSALGAEADPGNPVQSARIALQVAQMREQYLSAHKNTAAYHDAVKAVNDAQYQLTQAQAQASEAAAQGSVYPGSQMSQALAQLRSARIAVGAAEQGTAAWSQANSQLTQAQIAYGNAVLADQANVRLLGGDITDPVFRARQTLQTAQAQLRADRRRGAPGDVLHTDELAVRQDSAAAQAAAFQQRLSDAQTLHQLGQMSDAAYLRYLESEQTRLERIKHRTRQQTEELYSVEQAIKDANNQLSGQFNLGQIMMPTVYAARALAAAQRSGGASVQTVQITINDYSSDSRAQQLLNEHLGTGARGRLATTPPKVGS